MTNGRRVTVLLALLLGAVSATAKAQGDPNAAKSLIVEQCIACHRVPGYEGRSPPPALKAPDFQAIADDPGTYTPAYLHSFLSSPHFPMQKFIMSKSDIDNVIAFLQALRNTSPPR